MKENNVSKEIKINSKYNTIENDITKPKISINLGNNCKRNSKIQTKANIKNTTIAEKNEHQTIAKNN